MERQEKRCPLCKINKSVSEFGKCVTRHDGLGHYCRTCRREKDKQRYTDPNKRKKIIATSSRQYYENREYKLEQAKRYRQELRMGAQRAYGGENPCCACCGENHIEFLEVDHINNDGANHRREVGDSIQIFRWLRRENYPAGFQVLCSNCNKAKSIYGICPHQRE